MNKSIKRLSTLNREVKQYVTVEIVSGHSYRIRIESVCHMHETIFSDKGIKPLSLLT